jgi:hypothetical protein
MRPEKYGLEIEDGHVLYHFRNIYEEGKWKLYSSITSNAREIDFFFNKMEIKYKIKRLSNLEKDYDKTSRENNIFIKFEKEDTDKKMKSLKERTRLLKKNLAVLRTIRDAEAEQRYLDDDRQRQGNSFTT